MPLNKNKPVRVIFMDLDRTLIEPIPWPKLRFLNREAMHTIGSTLDQLHDRHNYVVVIVTNKPAGRVHDIAHAVLGKSAWNWHFAESGAVCVDLASYRHEVHERYRESYWLNVDRPELLKLLARAGVTQFEGGNQMVNVILVNPDIAAGKPASKFPSLVQKVLSIAPCRDRVSLSHGESGNLADISPRDYGKHLAANWAHSMLVDWADQNNFKLEWQHSYVFGDGESDAIFLDTIRELTGVEVVGACPSNASDMMLDRCKMASSSRVEEGTAENLKRLLKKIASVDSFRSISAVQA